MTTWTDISTDQVDTDSPVTQPLMTALRDNPVAITEGASGAPRIQNDAFDDDTIGAEKLQGGTDERVWVLARVASSSVGGVGTYALLSNSVAPGSATQPGDSRAASGLRFASSDGPIGSGTLPTGTWQCMGHLPDNATAATLFLRTA